MRMKRSRFYILGVWLFLGSLLSESWAQSAFELISRNRNISASNYSIYPDSIDFYETAPPAGKKPFYLSHYGRHGSRYLSNRKAYDIPYSILVKADSLGKLTAVGQTIKKEVEEILQDSEGRWGDLTGIGKRQHRDITCRMVKRYPEIFSGHAHIDARSTTVNRCIISMGEAMQQLIVMNPNLNITMESSKRDMWYMNHQDARLRNMMNSPEVNAAFGEFIKTRVGNPRLMQLIFNDSLYVKEQVDEKWLCYYLLKAALIQQNTSMGERSHLIDYFTYEEIHHFWQQENAWWYIRYGPSPLNGGEQPYTQRYLLRRIIEQADSCIHQEHPGAQLRFGHETIVLPLVCLLGVNGFDVQVDNLEQLEPMGWWACLVFPMASNIQLVFYRDNPNDNDILVKVLLNEKEAFLPLPDDQAPYYRWKDFREHYLHKLDAYEEKRAKDLH